MHVVIEDRCSMKRAQAECLSCRARGPGVTRDDVGNDLEDPSWDNAETAALVRWGAASAELRAALPRCAYSHACRNIGVKWIARTHLHCDTHGCIHDQDAPWAELARRLGLAGKKTNVEDGLAP